MAARPAQSNQTRNNWWVDLLLLLSGLAAALSGIYFLFLPQGGYRGGRNPYYGIQILFDRHTWEDFHTWGGLGMILVAGIHLALHWAWVTGMVRRIRKEFTGQCGCMNRRGRWNLILNTVVAASFLLTALSGLYFFFFPGGQGRTDPGLLFTRSTWDLIHTWAGVLLVSAAVLHFAIHWRWVVNVTARMTRSWLAALGISAQRTSIPDRQG